MLSYFKSNDHISKRQIYRQMLVFGMVLSTAFMIWRGLGVVTNTDSPIVVVLSGSMEPAFYRGDLLFLSNTQKQVTVGDMVVYKVTGKDIPIVHRVIEVHIKKNGEELLLTKGDNNMADDRGLYEAGERWISRSHIMGTVKGMVPYVGMATIILNDYPKLKILVVGSLGLFVMLSGEK